MDADEFLGKLQKLAKSLKKGEISEINLNLLIASTPIVDAVEVVHGRWIGETGGYMWRQNCSICNGPVYNKMKPYYNYCPYCGAKMDGEVKE